MNYHSPRDIIEVIDVMYLKAQNLAKDLNRKDLTDDDIKRKVDDIKELAKQVVYG